MRIPLDYYKILSLTVEATDEQLLQAYNDRLVQKPRREYNQQALESRQGLIEQAYRVLSDPEAKAEYDAQFLTNMQPDTTVVLEGEAAETRDEKPVEGAIATPLVNSTIDISPSQVVGALLIFHELGEYEQVLTLGIDYYNSEAFRKLQEQQKTEVQTHTPTQENIILALALAYLEMGREYGHQKKYEMATLSSQLSIDLLRQENLFPQVQQELELDLYKLRPHLVLELISQNPSNSAPRARGLQLLQKMLVQRQGIEGKGEDYSGLGFYRFLGFIQQLRTYLTSQEQQQLFDSETQRNSAIALYLAAYALLARGFCEKQPELILQAQQRLDRLSDKDVAWEQAVCALLLGDTENAIKKVHQTQDTTKLKQILQYSTGSADLLPGICFYSEQWLHKELVSQFVDLAKLTLNEYFADDGVQAYLDELAAATATPTPATTVSTPAATPTPATTLSKSAAAPTSNKDSKATRSTIVTWCRSLFTTKKSSDDRVAADGATQKETVLVGAEAATNVGNASGDRPNRSSGTKAHPKSSQVRDKQPNGKKSPKAKQNPSSQQHKTRAVPPSGTKNQERSKPKTVRQKKTKFAVALQGWLFIFSIAFGSVTLAFLATRLFLNPKYQTAKNAELAIAISDPTVEIPPVKAKQVVATKPTLTQQSRQTIEKWLSSKSAAFGKEHQIQQLNNILAEPLLTTWRDRATAHQQGDSYREYQHQVEMRSAKVDPNNPNRATVEARVKEVAQHYQSGQLDNALSYDDNLLVRYQLVRQGNKWLIENAEVLETL